MDTTHGTFRKEMTERQLEFAKRYLSKATGFLHYQFEGGEDSRRESIPWMENACFSLALFRTHMGESIQEGKDLLLRLLAFQNEEGAFPVYLHEYPRLKKPLFSVQMLFPLFFLWRDYRKVMDKELLAKLQDALSHLLGYIDQLGDLPELLIYQKEMVCYGLGRREAPADFDRNLLRSSKDWGDALLAEQIGELKPVSCWNEELSIYVGPLFHELQKCSAPRLTLLDLFMQKSEVVDDPILLRASLVQKEAAFEKPTEFSKEGFFFKEKEGMQLAYLKNFSSSDEKLSPGFHLLRLVTRDHTFVCQEREAIFHLVEKEEGALLIFEELSSEVRFFLSKRQGGRAPVWIEGARATTFYAGERLTFVSGGYVYTFSFNPQGEARFVGQVSFGNRPSQIDLSAKEGYASYDTEITLAPLSPEGPRRVYCSLTWQKIE